MMLEALTLEIGRAVVRFATGKLLTDSQIKSISNNVVGAHIAGWLPTPKEELEAGRRVDAARKHINEASRIILDLQNDLEKQAVQLDELSKEIEEKKKQLADRYKVLAQTNEETFAAFKAEMEQAVRKELIAQANKGKRIRQVAAITVWVITLVVGAALGAYIQFKMDAYMRGNIPALPAPQVQPQK
jgi:predicted phage tail protein